MSSDRELLELAAKAAGMVGYEYCRTDQGDYEYMAFDEGGSQSDYWNPLTEDVDAFRLSVKCDIYFMMVREQGHVLARVRNGVRSGWKEMLGQDEYAATRRAIVRAAASIGERMP